MRSSPPTQRQDALELLPFVFCLLSFVFALTLPGRFVAGLAITYREP